MSTSQLDQTGRDLMLRAMISMAAADGHIADVEAATVSAIFEKVAGESIDTAEVLAAAYVLRTEESNMSAALSAAVGELDDFAREAILRAASLVLLADGKALAPERERLVEMAEALQTPEPRVAALLEGLPD